MTHPDAKAFSEWCNAVDAVQHLSAATKASYKSDVARFLNNSNTPLRSLDEKTIERFLSALSDRVSSRMKSALSEFLAYARNVGVMSHDPLRNLKYGRGDHAEHRQLSLFAELSAEGVPATAIRKLAWEDFVAPLVSRCVDQLRIGRTSRKINRSLWRRLEVRFKRLVPTRDLNILLRQKIIN